MKWMSRYFFLLLIIFFNNSCVTKDQKITYLGSTEYLTGTLFNKVEIGGLSGIVFNKDNNTLYVVSDDQGDKYHPRLYAFNLKVNDGKVLLLPKKMLVLKDENQNPFKVNTLDFEGLTILKNGNFIVSSEGNSDKNPRIPTSIKEFNKKGQFIADWPLADKFKNGSRPDMIKGTYRNKALESLTITPDKKVVFTVNEQSLIQDGPLVSIEKGGLIRLVRYKRNKNKFVADGEFVYPLSALPNPSKVSQLKGDNGVADLVALNENELLVLERAFIIPPMANVIKIFKVKIEKKSTNVSELHSIKDREITILKKELLLNLSDIVPVKLDNLEGMCLGPKLKDGKQLLILVSDNNFNKRQRTLFLFFTIRP